MNIKSVDAGVGVQWLAEGWRLFTLNPGMWIVLLIIYVIVTFGLNFVPLVGRLASLLITPALAGGLFYAARELDQGRDITIEHLFVGLTDPQKRNPLLILGGVYLAVCVLMFAALMMLGGGAAMMGAMMQGHLAAGLAAGSAMITILVTLSIGLVVAMAYWFAVPLVMFAATPPAEALQGSISGCLKNMVPMLVFGVVWFVLAMIASLPAMLGWLVLGPVTAAAAYTSYKSIFGGP